MVVAPPCARELSTVWLLKLNSRISLGPSSLVRRTERSFSGISGPIFRSTGAVVGDLFLQDVRFYGPGPARRGGSGGPALSLSKIWEQARNSYVRS